MHLGHCLQILILDEYCNVFIFRLFFFAFCVFFIYLN